jgi:hypothetical protein
MMMMIMYKYFLTMGVRRICKAVAVSAEDYPSKIIFLRSFGHFVSTIIQFVYRRSIL